MGLFKSSAVGEPLKADPDQEDSCSYIQVHFILFIIIIILFLYFFLHVGEKWPVRPFAVTVSANKFALAS